MYIPCVCCPNGDAHMHIVRTFDKNVLPCGSSGIEMTRYNRLFGDSMPMQAVPPSHVTVNKPEAPEDYVDDVTIETVSEKIGLRRKKFGVRLGLSWSEVNKFNTQKGEEAVKNMMWYWRSKMQSRMQHQLKLLCVALRHYGFKTFADSLFKGDTESIVIEEQAEQDCFSDQDLLFICDNLPVGWRKLARQLGFEQAVIDDIATYNHQWESDSNMHMLAIWKMGHSEKQMPIMIKALKKTGFDQVAERVCERHDYNDKAVYQNRCRPKGNWWYWPTWAVLLLGCILFVVFLTLAHTQDKMQNTLYTAVYVVGGIMSSISFLLLLSDKLKKYRKRRKSKEANRRYTHVLQKDI
ncbi:uncharacterized protein LOC117124910 [Anneissia japonica]|uniref:uncharacterized protein LOC117124910 n=1 Tax=Anneissia japonica TaxID=1529436 RepID=UPI00142593B1|nr:uncharacterized protein LOC117124910 [Anneissia japonica]